MESTFQNQYREGDSVVSLDGETVGKLYAIEDGFLHVEKGWLFPKDYQIPMSVIRGYDQDNGLIHLSVSKDEALNSDWVQYDERFVVGSSGTSTDASTNTWEQSDGMYASDEGIGNAGYSGMGNDLSGTTSGAMVDDDDQMVIPVHEEELTATKRDRAAGEVQINKRVVAEEQAMDVPITEERVNITRRVVDRDATTGEDVFSEETIEVPLRTEEVNLEKRTRVAEEIEVDKERVQRTERVSGTVRREEVEVDETAAGSYRNDPGTGASQ